MIEIYSKNDVISLTECILCKWGGREGGGGGWPQTQNTVTKTLFNPTVIKMTNDETGDVIQGTGYPAKFEVFHTIMIITLSQPLCFFYF